MKKLICLIILTFIAISISIASVANPIFENGRDNGKDGNKVAKQNAKQSTFSVMPSTQTEKISLKFNEAANVSSVKMINNQSDVVYQGTKSRGASNVLDLPIEDLEPGTYFIRVQTDKGVSVERIKISK